MKLLVGSLIALFVWCLAQEAQAQFVPPPVPVPQPVIVSGNGFDFVYARRNLLVTGSVGTRIYSVAVPGLNPYPLYSPAPWAPLNVYPYPLAPYGFQQNRIIVQYINPAPIVAGYRRADPTEGIDLDAQPLTKPAPEPPPLPQPKIEPKVPDPEPDPAPQLPGVDVSKPKPAIRPDDPEAHPKPEPKPPTPAPKADAHLGEAVRMRQGGKTAFREGRYGLAVLRFIQATELDKADARSRFLLGQAHFALGKYPEAVTALHKGLQLDMNWPSSDFRPRAELYNGHEAGFDWQIKRLEEVVKSNPKDAAFGFLLAYQYWFDGRRAEAVPLLRNIRPLTPDPTCVDLFLAKAGPENVAAHP